MLEPCTQPLPVWPCLFGRTNSPAPSLQTDPVPPSGPSLTRPRTPVRHMHACRLFMAGHVSKASDVYAYGILLYELITGQCAYAGVPVLLLPHEVALQGLRPEWPRNMPAESSMLCDLAEACWQHKPQDRCVCVC